MEHDHASEDHRRNGGWDPFYRTRQNERAIISESETGWVQPNRWTRLQPPGFVTPTTASPRATARSRSEPPREVAQIWLPSGASLAYPDSTSNGTVASLSPPRHCLRSGTSQRARRRLRPEGITPGAALRATAPLRCPYPRARDHIQTSEIFGRQRSGITMSARMIARMAERSFS